MRLALSMGLAKAALAAAEHATGQCHQFKR
jgi:hypothetical protein